MQTLRPHHGPLGPSWHFSVTPDICARVRAWGGPHPSPLDPSWRFSMTPGICVASVRA